MLDNSRGFLISLSAILLGLSLLIIFLSARIGDGDILAPRVIQALDLQFASMNLVLDVLRFSYLSSCDDLYRVLSEERAPPVDPKEIEDKLKRLLEEDMRIWRSRALKLAPKTHRCELKIESIDQDFELSGGNETLFDRLLGTRTEDCEELPEIKISLRYLLESRDLSLREEPELRFHLPARARSLIEKGNELYENLDSSAMLGERYERGSEILEDVERGITNIFDNISEELASMNISCSLKASIVVENLECSADPIWEEECRKVIVIDCREECDKSGCEKICEEKEKRKCEEVCKGTWFNKRWRVSIGFDLILVDESSRLIVDFGERKAYIHLRWNSSYYISSRYFVENSCTTNCEESAHKDTIYLSTGNP